MKKLLIALVIVILVVLTTTTAFASGDEICNEEGQRICTQQCSADGEGQMNRWQYNHRKTTKWAEAAMGAGRGSGLQQCDQCATE